MYDYDYNVVVHFRIFRIQLSIVIFLLSTFEMVRPCHFPDVFYTDTEKFQMTSPDADVSQEHYFREVEVNDNVMTIKAFKNTYGQPVADIVIFECVEKEENSLIIRRIKYGEDDKYACMEFIERTSYVFQWRLGGLTKSRGSVSCQDDQMILQDAALVNKKLAENIDTYYDRKT